MADFGWLQDLSADSELGGPSPEDLVRDAEGSIGFFPTEYRDFVRQVGYARLGPYEIHGVGDGVPNWQDVVSETLVERTASGRPLPDGLIAVMNNGGGDIFCVRSPEFAAGEEDGRVFVWCHDDDASPEPVAASFVEWIRSLAT